MASMTSCGQTTNNIPILNRNGGAVRDEIPIQVVKYIVYDGKVIYAGLNLDESKEYNIEIKNKVLYSRHLTEQIYKTKNGK